MSDTIKKIIKEYLPYVIVIIVVLLFKQFFFAPVRVNGSSMDNTLKDKDILLLKNIEFISNDDLEIKIDSNIKSSNVIALKVGDNYTESELMKRMKNNGYSCK